ncbi:MAG TPA: hypothetical protein VMB83_06035 [Roseiarcus sp.]|jgi:hypothetical protein|nr:hypothetical protein [Roseiarcus sp.]
MRMMLRIHIDATHGSAALKSGALQQAIGGFIAKFKPEATYFGLESGQRTGFFVFDMKDSEQCPEVAEAFFDTGCDIHLSPCMTPDDLQNGLAVAGLTARG